MLLLKIMHIKGLLQIILKYVHCISAYSKDSVKNLLKLTDFSKVEVKHCLLLVLASPSQDRAYLG